MAKSGWDWNLFRLAVIEAAIRGKLTAEWRVSNPNIEPAHTLLERIAEEKAELVRTKQIRKEKPLTPINPDEVPCDIPEKWGWARLQDIIIGANSGKSPKCENRPALPHEFGVMKTTAVKPGIYAPEFNKVLPQGFEINEAWLPEKGNILVTRAGTVDRTGNACLVQTTENRVILSDKIVKLKVANDFNARYLVYALNSPMLRRSIIDFISGGTAQLNISQADLKKFPIPFPHSLEQEEIVRILSALDSGGFDGPVHPVVARIQKLEKEFRALAGEYESQEKWLSDLRSALLQEAISGQLTADWRAANPDIEPAHALLERIAEEKAELVRTKQIRKEKPLPPIHPDEIPYDIPESWEWTRVGEMSQIIAGFSFKKPQYQDQGLRIIRISDFDQKGFTDDSVVRYKYSEDLERYRIKNGDILMPMTGSIGKNHRVSELPEDDCFLNQRIAIVRTSHSSSEFLNAVLSSSATIEAHRACMKSTNGNISLGDVRGTLIPLPCSEEQQEIVRRLKMQLEKLDALQLELEQSKEAGQLLMKSKLAEVFDLDSQD